MSNIKKLSKPLTILIIILISSIFMAACNAPAEKLNQEGNQAFAEKAYLEALERYQSAQVESPELAEPYFNAANTFYRQGDFPAALEQMQLALQYVDEATLAESSLFNLGNTLYNSQELNQAIEAYTQALLLDPEDLDAKHNLELALQQQEQQQQQQDQNQEQQENSQNEDQNQSEEQSEEGDQSEDEQEGEQGDQSQESEDQGDHEEPNQEGDQQQENEAQNEESQDEENGQQQQGEPSQGGEQPGQVPPPGQRMTEEQARQLLAALANNMETLQEHLGQYLFARQAPPLQDW